MTFEKGNKYSTIWTLENAKPRFEDAVRYAENNDSCLCFQDAVAQSGIPIRTFYQLAKNHPDLQTIKEDIHAYIVSRVNKKALEGTYAPSPAIWRMKQSGEREESDLNLKGSLEVENKIDEIEVKRGK